MSLLAAVIWVVIPSTPAYAQDQPPQPSLGDVARQARKDKEKNKAQAKTVITDDTLPSSKGLSGLAASDLGGSQGSGDAGSAMARALDRVNEGEVNLKKLDALDRATVAKELLMANDREF